MILEIKKEIDGHKNKKHAESSARFFKTGIGEYAEGDYFIGVKVPILRRIARKYKDISLKDIKSLLISDIHEYRFIALVLLINKCRGNLKQQEKIFNFYVKNYKHINNWDLVDISAPHIFGAYLFDKPRDILYEFAKSSNLWKKRIAIVSCFAFIRNNNFKDILKVSEILLNDEHDLIHKAIGWMLREVGKRDINVLEDFLNIYHQKMPRVCLRYAIERMDEKKRKSYLLF
jgi:3-methyladenine DNA glycosylase AlkD